MAIITISRGTKSGGQAIAEYCAGQFHWPIVGWEVVQQAAAKLGVSEEALGRKMEDAPKLWDRHSATRRLYVAAVQAALAEHVAEGNLVYHGLAGGVLLRGLPSVLRVRLIAPIELRVRTLMEEHQMDQVSAEQFIRDVDAARASWVKIMYGEDINSPTLYDMVINLERMPVPVACALVTATVRQPDFAVTDEVKAKLRDFRLACRVKVALAGAAETRGLALEVEAQGGVVEVSGSAPLLSTGRTGDHITQIARSVPGVEQVRLKVEWFDPYP
ncbi:MAG: hypothetical protein GTO22_26275 [Gemmatimonadales bacterium]|nr:hypothetical protein [Gemmatimonadales bacterium]